MQVCRCKNLARQVSIKIKLVNLNIRNFLYKIIPWFKTSENHEIKKN